MTNTVKKVLSSAGFQQSVVTIFGSLSASAIAAVSTIIITRQLGPEQFGIFSVGFAIAQILVRLTDLGMTNVVQRFGAREKEEKEKNYIYALTTRVRLIAYLALVIIGVFGATVISSILSFNSPTIVAFAFILAGATGLYEHFQAILQSLHLFTKAALANVIQSLCKFFLATLLLFFNSVSVLPVFVGYLVAPVLPFVFYRYLFPSWVKLSIDKNHQPQIKHIERFATHSAFAFISAGIIENIDIVFVQKYLTTYDAGLLGGVGRIALLFSVIGYAIGNVLNTRVAKYTQKKDLRNFLQKAILFSIFIVCCYFLFIPFSGTFLKITIGSEYFSALKTMNILVASSFLTVAVVPFIALFFSFEKSWYFSSAGLLQLIIVIAGNMIFVPLYGLEAAAWTRLVARLGLFIFTLLLAVYTYRNLYGKTDKKTHTSTHK